MKNNNLKNTKIRLTVIFTLLVFFIAVFLETVFFSIKYYNYTAGEFRSFDLLTRGVEDRKISLKEFTSNYSIDNRVFKMKKPDRPIKREEYVNLIVIDKSNSSVIFSNVTDDIEIDFVRDILVKNEYGIINIRDGYLVKKILLEELSDSYDVLFIKDLKYDLGDYFEDLFGFIFFTFLFSALFYYAGYRFVSKNLEPLEQNLKDMQDFVHNAGHELKTPIAIINSNLQLIKATKNFEKDLIDEGIQEVNKLDKLIESLVELSTLNISEKKEKINLEDEIKSIIKDFKPEVLKKDIKVKFDKKLDSFLNINKQHFYILFSNILGNAIKYTLKGGEIDINLNSNGFSIKDNGIGIKKEELDKIFDRFYMGTSSRNATGFGIGLSLVKKISDIYSFDIKVKSEEKKGSEFVVIFK